MKSAYFLLVASSSSCCICLKYEKETIILFNESEGTVSIYTLNAGLKKRPAMFSKKYSDLCRQKKAHEQGGVSYVLDKSRLSIRP